MSGVYQTQDYRDALASGGVKIVEISENFFAVERKINSVMGSKLILEARGNFNEEELNAFKAKAKGYFYGTIAPCVLNKDEELFSKLGFNKVENHTILIDLSKTEEELWHALEKKSVRWGAKTAEKNGLSFVEMKMEELDEFYQLYEGTAKQGGFSGESKAVIKNLLGGDIAKLFLVKKQKEIVAGGMILIDKDNNYSILDLTAASDGGLKLQAMPFLYWNLVVFSKSAGLRYFDLGGYDSEAREGEKTHAINKYKERFGGRIEVQPVYSTNWKYKTARSLLRKFRFIKRIYKKD